MFHQKEERKRLESFGQGKIGRMRNKVWNLTEYPETSRAALVLGYCSLGLVIVSTVTFVLGTFPGNTTSASKKFHPKVRNHGEGPY